MTPDEIALRPPVEADSTALLAWRSDPEHQRLLMWRTGASSLSDVQAWVERRTADPNGLFLIVASGPTPIGFVQLTNIDRVDGHACLGMLIAMTERGQGAGARALALMEKHARDLDLRKIMLEVLGDNTRALRFWTTAGYRVVGSLRQHHQHAAAFHDVSLLEKLLHGAGGSR